MGNAGGGGALPLKCSTGKASCDGPVDDDNGCETDLERSQTCGHCERSCGDDACLVTQAMWSCQVRGHVAALDAPVVALAAAGPNVYWSTVDALHWLNVETNASAAVPLAATALAADEDGVYAATAAGDIVALTFPAASVTTLASQRLSPKLVRVDSASVYWVEGPAIVRASKTARSIETFYDQLLGMELRDLEIDSSKVWVGAYEPKELGVTCLSIDKATRSPTTLSSLGSEVAGDTVEIALQGEQVYVASVDAIRPYQKDGTPLPTMEGQWAAPGAIGDLLVRGPFVIYRSEQQHAVLRSSDGFDTALYDGTVTHLALGDRVFFSSADGVFSSALVAAPR